MTPRTPNYALAYHLARLGWSNAETARRLNAYANQQGHRGIAVGPARLGRWIRHGERPRPPIPALLATLLATHLREPITGEELGLATAESIRVRLTEAELDSLHALAAAAKLTAEQYAVNLLRKALRGVEHDSR